MHEVLSMPIRGISFRKIVSSTVYTCSATGPPISLLSLTYFLTAVSIKVSKSSIICGKGSATVLGIVGSEATGATPAGAADGGKVPFVFGASATADAISSRRDVAASSLRIIGVSSILVIMIGASGSFILTV